MNTHELKTEIRTKMKFQGINFSDNSYVFRSENEVEIKIYEEGIGAGSSIWMSAELGFNEYLNSLNKEELERLLFKII